MGLIVAPKVHRKLKSLRVQEQMSKFEAAMAQGQIEEASKFLQVAQMLRPESPDVQRGVRILNASKGVPAALSDTQRLMALNAATPDELLILGEQALKEVSDADAQEKFREFLDFDATAVESPAKARRRASIKSEKAKLPSTSKLTSEMIQLADGKFMHINITPPNDLDSIREEREVVLGIRQNANDNFTAI